MPLPMVHLAVAMQLRSNQRTFPPSAFLLGSIAPDAIHIRRDAQVDDKHHVHLRKAADKVELSRIRSLLTHCQNNESDTLDFAEGYIVHILTDMVWFSTIYEIFRASLPATLNKQERRTLYYQETDQIDFNLYAKMPWRSKVWEVLNTVEPVDFGTLLTAEEIRGWQQRVLHWFGEIKEEPKIQPKYITDQMVQQFITNAARTIVLWFSTQLTAISHHDSDKRMHYFPKNISISQTEH